MTDKLSELIGKLPKEIRPLAKIYADVLQRTGTEEVGKWIRYAILTNWREAHTRLVQSMTADEIIASQKATNQLLIDLNNENKAFVDAQRDALLDLLTGALVAL